LIQVKAARLTPSYTIVQSNRDLCWINAMTKPIPDKAAVAVEYPDKFYIGTFGASARFDAHVDETGK
jgi:hypothetical protein